VRLIIVKITTDQDGLYGYGCATFTQRADLVRPAVKHYLKPLLIIVSHTNLNSRTGGGPRIIKMMQPRLISKEHAKVVAEAGGVVGVWTHLAGSLPDFVESIKSMVDAIGIDHVGIGSDTDLLSSRAGQGTDKAWPGLTGGFFNAVASEMLRQGFTSDEIVKAGGGNYCRVFGEVTARHV
jgi:membrane dipeptidase